MYDAIFHPGKKANTEKLSSNNKFSIYYKYQDPKQVLEKDPKLDEQPTPCLRREQKQREQCQNILVFNNVSLK